MNAAPWKSIRSYWPEPARSTVSYTRLRGGGELTYRFLNEYSADRADVRLDIEDAKHISQERREQLENEYLPHERSEALPGYSRSRSSN